MPHEEQRHHRNTMLSPVNNAGNSRNFAAPRSRAERTLIRHLRIIAGLSLLALTACGERPPDPNDPDLLLVNARIVTMDDQGSVIEALAVRGHQIVALGATARIRKFAGPNTRTIDLDGRTVTPGLIDVHNHFAWGAVDRYFSVNLAYPAVTRIDDILARVREKAEADGPGTWIIGTEWDAGKLAEGRDLTAADLDRAAPDNPVWLLHASAHYGVANSEALALAGVTRDSADPEGGVIARDSDGALTGILTDQAMDLINAVTPPTTAGQFAEATARLAPELSAEGITTIKDPEIDERHWQAYQQVHAGGGLPVRVFALWRAPDTIEDAKRLIERIGPFTDPAKASRDDQVVSGGVKIYIDGSGTARTAWVYESWNRNLDETDEGNVGLTYLEPHVLLEQIRLFHKAGMHLGVHAIGDRAIDFTLDAYDQVLAEHPVYGLRHSIIHCNIPTDHAMDLMFKLQNSYDAAYPEVQPAFLWWIGDAYAGNFGPARNARVLPLKTFGDRGIRWAASSDYNVSPFAPRFGLWSAVARQALLGRYGAHPFGTEESIPVHEALIAYTRSAARQVFMQDRIGSIEAGKYADIVVWDRDPYSVPPDELKEMKALLTLMNGRIVYEDSRFADAAN